MHEGAEVSEDNERNSQRGRQAKVFFSPTSICCKQDVADVFESVGQWKLSGQNGKSAWIIKLTFVLPFAMCQSVRPIIENQIAKIF